MPVSGNEETAVKSLGGQSSLNIAGVPMKKRRFIWPPSPTPEEQSSLPVENDSLEKERIGPSRDSEFVNTSVAASSSVLSDSNKNLVPEENKKPAENNFLTNNINLSRYRIEEPSAALSDSLAKFDDDEMLVAAEKSANIMTGVKPLGGVPVKKRRFILPPSPARDVQTLPAVGNDSLQKEHGNLSQESAPSSACVAGSSCLSDENKNFLPEDNKMVPESIMLNNTINHSRVKIEEPHHTMHPDSLAKLDDAEKLVAAEKSTNILVKSAETELNLVPNTAPAFYVNKEIFNHQIAEGKCKEKSTVSGNPEFSLGLKDYHRYALEGQSHDENSCNHGNVEPVSLNLSLSNSERSTQYKMDDVQSNTDSANICADRSNWDLNTTMDTWEDSVSDIAVGQVTAEGSGSHMVGVLRDLEPSKLTGIVGTGVSTEKQIIESECRSSCSKISSQSGQQHNSEDSLHLRLIPSFLSFSSQKPSSSCANKDSQTAIPNISFPRGLLSAGNTVNSRTIKSEPFDDNSLKQDSSGTKANPTVPLGFRPVSVKCELVEKLAQDPLKALNFSTVKPVDAKSMKSEPFHEGNSETPKTVDGTSHQSDKQVLHGEDTGGQSTCSTNEHILQGQDITGQPTCSTNKHALQVQDTGGQPTSSMHEQVLQGHSNITKPTCSIGFSENGNVSDNLGRSEGDGEALFNNKAPKESCESVGQLALEMGSLPVSHSGDEINDSGAVDVAVAEKKKVNDFDQCKLKVMNELPSDPYRNGEGAVSDEEKINLSGDMLEEDLYGTEYESDGNSVPMDIEEDSRVQDDYEDGEVREPQLHGVVESAICEERKDFSHSDSDGKKVDSAELHADVHPTSSYVEGKKTNGEEPVEISKDSVEGCTVIILDGKPIDVVNKEVSGNEPSAVEISVSGADKRKVVKPIRRKSLDLSANKDVMKGLGTEQSLDQASSGGQGTLVAVAQGTDENVKTNDVEKNDSALPKVETSVNADDATKDANGGANQSRIINLSIASNMSSAGKMRYISDKPFSSLPGRERLPDIPLEGDKLHPRGRDETNEDSRKFSRERYQDQSSRYSRWNYVHGRGRLASRIDSMRSDRDSERDCIPRHKYASAVAGSEAEFMNYNIGPDGAFVGSVRGGRKLLEDETSIFRHLSSRRRSPGGRDGPASRGLPMVRRVPRSIGEDNSEVVGLRHAEKIMRGFHDDGEQHAYARPQPPYEGLDGRFVQGSRNFSSVQRRGLPQMHSKSPIRSRSPGPWSSSRRRSPDGFGGHPEMPHRRSPIYRMERIRSPDNPGFPAERVPRRHGSPSYLSRPNDLREMDPGRDHGHPRSIISNRSPTGRVFLRNSRRFGVADPREMTENDEFYEGPMHPGRFHELGDDGNGEERRFGERRAPVRAFRPHFNGADGENFPLDTEDGPRSFRFFPEDDPNFHERTNLRGREFDRRIKNRPGNAPRRPRSIEEQEGNYGHGGQVLYDDNFDDMSRVKRKRF
ncbi:hypothetical protein P3X46_025447 [Hevea brasiliensis]|uniref:Uncharacterized protein n=1 Tax=Hevea brasiliensis TaxID=3981 RepID=A0ABQ9L974_HEVBR|nr:uncharacterized protein LOC110669871 [Hevea brasiliensis]XP_057989478.1 uncharacterized protein LOC110669871 [Hevea brasiliensis]KAJ9160005.1 hypothetical protein P3X46_025447 [Hevea brasiliensis]KAJ9160006.1 hypothetical protein P3X46_025447 [Hevea brasiliensis]